MSTVWKVSADVMELLDKVLLNHMPRLANARFAVAFSDTKPFVKNRFNWGRVTKFTNFNKLWHGHPGYDFSIILCADAWHDLLSSEQHEANLDLLITRCGVEYEPEMVIEGNKKVVVKDEWGRIQYTDKVKTDDEGNIKWKIDPLDLEVFAQNTLRYGLWMEPFVNAIPLSYKGQKNG